MKRKKNIWQDWPDEGDAGFVAVMFSNGDMRTQLAHFHDGKWVLDLTVKKPKKIFAWMQLPQWEENRA